MKVVLIILVLTFFFSFHASALSCNPQSFIEEYQENNIPPNIVNEGLAISTCENTNGNSTSISLNGQNISYFILSNYSIGNETQTIRLKINSNILHGSYFLAVSFGVTNLISGIITIIPPQNQNNPNCQINPSLVSYTQQIQQGTRTSLPKITFSPVGCNGTFVLTPSNVYVQGGVVTPTGQKPIYISSVESNGINLNIDTTGLNTQTYQSKLIISSFGNQYEIPLNIIVTGGTQQGNFNINNMPQCSLTNNILNTNQTYSMVCSNIQPDVKIIPIIDTEYIIGMGKQSELNQIIWLFKPIKFGITKIKADFSYLDMPVGAPFIQEVKIQATSGSVGGTYLALEITPKLAQAKNGELVIIQVIDNNSRSLIDNSQLYINGILNENRTGHSFRYAFEIGKNYSVRATSPGYMDLIDILFIEISPIAISFSPISGDTKTIFTINTNANATIYINGEKKGNSYTGNLFSGNNTIGAFKEGFSDTYLNIVVDNSIEFYTSGEFKKGIEQIIELNKNTTWVIFFKKDSNSLKETLLMGTGSRLSFTPKKVGTYTIETEDGSQKTFIIEGFSMASLNFFSLSWYYWLIIIILIVIIISVYRSKNSSSNLPYSGNTRMSD